MTPRGAARLVAFAACTLATWDARADSVDDGTDRAPPPKGADASASPAGRRSPYGAIQVNPLALLIGRQSADIEVWPLSSFGITGGLAHVDYTRDAPAAFDHPGEKSRLTLVEGELGARAWWWLRPSTRAQPSSPLRVGAFLGPSLAYARGMFVTDRFPSGDESSHSFSPQVTRTAPAITQWTGAIDGGISIFVRPLILSLGGGLQYRRSSPPPQTACFSYFCFDGTEIFHGDGIRPRLLLSVGVAI